ncbi:protein prenylyltransferase [Cristinia sonorae]|uniref:Protein prenylyltransferase n=1 Tax=Cristinia sonorae TaxID=1940300 RepID=A0A8K0UXE3_9AGAR|nr:protein prenylyltransferase [Cristinia sonorae]
MQSTIPPTSPLSERFNSLVWSFLDAELHRSALFYAERYYVNDPTNHDARHLFATVLLRAGQSHSAHHLVNQPADSRCIGCLEIKSRCCTALGRHREARVALDETLADPNYVPGSSSSSRAAQTFPSRAALHCTAGLTAMKGKQPDAAAASFREALKADPMMWEAFEGLCTLGFAPDIDEIWPPVPEPSRNGTNLPGPVATGAGFFTPEAGSSSNIPAMFGNNGFPPFRAPGPRDSLASVDSSFYAEDSFRLDHLRPSRSQPAVTSLAVQPPAVRPLSSADETGPVAKKPRSNTRQRTAPPSTTAAESNLRPSKSSGALLQGAGENTKISKTTASKLNLGNIGSSKSSFTGAVTRRMAKMTSGKQPLSKVVQNSTKDRKKVAERIPPLSDSEMDEDAAPPHMPPPIIPIYPTDATPMSPVKPDIPEEVYERAMAEYTVYKLTRTFAIATKALSVYDCRTCLEVLDELPGAQQRSASVMAMVGKAHYELGEYTSAQRAFEAARNLEPYRVWDMEVYSTLLWHLRRSVQLTFLAQELLSINARSPQAWIAVGNTFSLQKERMQALTCFRRAAQLDPGCAYAYTLSGHELIDEDFDKAINFFQSALRADARHYNAWYGLGTCYMRMSKLRLADYHFRKAAEIHPKNAILLGCVGMVHERSGNPDAALALFDEAIRMSPDNALVRYHRAKVLISMKRYDPAIADLESLRDSSPDESNVIFQLARVYRLTGQKVKAAQLLAVARDVSPKSVSKIRKLLETIPDDGSAGDDVMDEG